MQYNCRYRIILIAATILAAILDFSLIAGVWNVYPRNFLPPGDVVIEEKQQIFAVHIKMLTEHLSAVGS